MPPATRLLAMADHDGRVLSLTAATTCCFWVPSAVLMGASPEGAPVYATGCAASVICLRWFYRLFQSL